MGRHRRSAVTPATDEHGAEGADSRQSGHRRKRSGASVRTGMVGVSAALAVGAVAMSSGLIPGGDTLTIGGGAADRVRADSSPDTRAQGGSGTPAERGTTAADRGTGRSGAPAHGRAPTKSPSATPSASKPKSSAEARKKPSAPASKPAAVRTTAPAAPEHSTTPRSSAPTARSSAVTGTRAAVLALVNQERAKVGCSPLTASSPLASLAQNYSEDMAARGFFDHTDPDGRSPWDRASKAGVRGLAAENIARGQANAQAVMTAWMNSPGHRANILNCDYKTFGLGVHFASGGPWWTQEFGF
ncbi:CAP domain-containing protein [Streptomyces sp. NPDC056347]|uniref:CAP domain-containing protein n=1 Tax=Streptomyces sp. NPDC056347 TaxID=3345790 RepID=UPI0035DD42C4